MVFNKLIDISTMYLSIWFPNPLPCVKESLCATVYQQILEIQFIKKKLGKNKNVKYGILVEWNLRDKTLSGRFIIQTQQRFHTISKHVYKCVFIKFRETTGVKK